MDKSTSRAPFGLPARSRTQGSQSAGSAAEEPQWYVISEDRSLSLRVVSGAILCEGEDGELVVSAEHAAHAARFDVIDDALWLSCLSGRIRADGRPVTSHHRLSAGAQIHIGSTRYFVAGEINEEAPDVPLLDNAMAPGDSRLPKPSRRHIPVFYSGPLEIEEIIITESASTAGSGDESDSASAKPARSSTPATPTRPAPDRNPGNHRGRLTSLLVAGLLASATFAGWQVISTAEGRRILAAVDPIGPVSADVPHPAMVLPAPAAPSRPIEIDEDDPVIVELAWLAWAEDINESNHADFVATAGSLDPVVLTGVVREHVDHYARRLLTDVTDADRLEGLVLSLGPVLAPHPVYRGTLATLEKRIAELARSPDRLPFGRAPELRVAALDGPAKINDLE